MSVLEAGENFYLVEGELLPKTKLGRCGWLGCEHNRLLLILLYGEGKSGTEYIYLCDEHAVRFIREMNGEG